MADVILNWSGSTSQTFKVEHKKDVDSTWIVDITGLTLQTYTITGLDAGTLYDFRVTATCPSGSNSDPKVTSITTTEAPTYTWIEQTFSCEQTIPFNLAATYTGFSSPQDLMWDEISGRYYVVDADDGTSSSANGWAFYYFNPDTITGHSSVTYITNDTDFYDVNTWVFDPTNRRIIAAGSGSNGAKVLDIATNTVSTLTYGSNNTPGNPNRIPLVLSSDKLYCFMASPNSINVYNRATLALLSTIDKTTIPSNSIYFTSAYHVTFIGSEAWVGASQRSNGDIAIYNSDFSGLVGTITLPGIATPSGGTWTQNPTLFWQGHYYDADNNRFYVADIGSCNIYVINTLTKAIINQYTITNRRGKNYIIPGLSKSELDGKVYLSITCTNNIVDTGTNSKLYKLNPTTGNIENMYPDVQTQILRLRPGTTEQWGCSPGNVIWNSPNTNWNTDGLILKYQ